jgi:hypothetical protein
VPLSPDRAVLSVEREVGGGWVTIPDFRGDFGLDADGDFLLTGLPAGSYRIGFHDTRTDATAYVTEYWDDATTASAATPIEASAGDVTGDHDVLVAIAKPASAPSATPTAELDPDAEGAIDAPDSAKPGDTLAIDVGEEHAGEWVSVWGHSAPVLFGSWIQVPSNGTLSVQVPATFPAGGHTLVVQGASGAVLGWTPLTITSASGASLPRTGSEIPGVAVTVSFSAILLGGALVGIALRSPLARRARTRRP